MHLIEKNNFIMEVNMSKINRLLFTFFLLVSWSIVTLGSGISKSGTAGASELRIPIGARYLAMGGSQIAAVSGLDAVFWNPAGLDFAQSNANAMFSYRKYIFDMSINNVAVSGKFGNLGSVGISFNSFNIGDINVTTEDQPDGTGQIISPTYFILGLTYSNKITDRISVGANFKLVNESFGRVSGSAFTVDAGVQYRNLMNIKGFSLGIAVKNLGGSIKYDGNAAYIKGTQSGSDREPTWYKIEAETNPLPSEMSIGLSYEAELDDINALTIAGTYTNNNYTFDDYKAGLEYSYDNTLYLRGGYIYSPLATEDNPNIFGTYSFGAGLNFMQITNINLSLDYAFVPVEYFDVNHVFSLRIGF